MLPRARSRPGWLSAVSCFLLLVCADLPTGQETGTDVRRQLHHTHAPHTPTPSTDAMDNWIASTSSKKPNVLLLIADDLRPKLGCYGDSNMVTPNLDYLASRSVMFKRAYVQVALCSPSRTSFLTGRRPDTTRVFDLHTYFRKVAGNFTTLPQYFKQHGYLAQGVGKIFHPGMQSSGDNDKRYSWSIPVYDGHNPFDADARHLKAIHPVNETVSGKLQDTTIADFAVDFLHTHGRDPDQPFFLAVGFHKPHLPWIFPKQYLDLYPLSHMDLAQHRTRPPLLPSIAWSASSEIRSYGDVKAVNVSGPDNMIPDYYQKKLRQAYSAATSYVDGQVGRVLHALSHNGLAQNTVVAFLGDHGWQLGDNAEWCKHTNFDMALRIPMMLYVPGVTAVGHGFDLIDALDPCFRPHPHGPGTAHVTDELVEAVDLYPTLAQLCGLPVPHTCPEQSLHVPACTEGTSLVPLVKRVRNLPSSSTASSSSRSSSSGHSGDEFQWKQAAFSQYLRGSTGRRPTMGYSVRTASRRYTEWVHFDTSRFAPNFSSVVARELYDHQADPGEFHNLAEVTSHHGEVQSLSRILRDGWRKTLSDYVSSFH